MEQNKQSVEGIIPDHSLQGGSADMDEETAKNIRPPIFKMSLQDEQKRVSRFYNLQKLKIRKYCKGFKMFWFPTL